MRKIRDDYSAVDNSQVTSLAEKRSATLKKQLLRIFLDKSETRQNK